jgi:hypothetical protein
MIVLFGFSCTGPNHSLKLDGRRITVQTGKMGDVSSFFKGYHYISLETLADNLISNIDKIQIWNNQLWILDKKTAIYIFDLSGKYVRQFNHRGQGPGEYLDIADFQVAKGKVYILSRSLKKILVYDDMGTFVKSYHLDDFYDFFYLTNDVALLYSNYSNNKLYNVITFDLSTERYGKKFLPFPENQSFSFPISPFNISANSKILLTQQYDYTVYSLQTDSISAIASFDFDTKEQLPDDIYKREGFYNAYEKLRDKSVVKRISYVCREGDVMYIMYILDYKYVMTKVHLSSAANQSLILEYNDKIPYIFANPIMMYGQCLVTYLNASDVLKFDKGFKSDKKNSGVLSEEDNPILFFNELNFN